jgi:hypothetical protein
MTLFSDYALVLRGRTSERGGCNNDLTGLFWTKPYERIGLAKELGNAEEAV